MKYSLTEKLFALLTGFLVLLATPSFAFAQTATSSSKAMMRAQAKAQRLDTRTTNLKERADKEIDRRVASLTKLISRINDMKRVTADQKTTLTTQVQNAITSLTALKAKIDADTDITTLQTDVKSVITEYRVYALLIPEIEIIAAADRELDLSDKLSSISGKLQARIQDAQSKGKDVSSLQTMLSDMQAKISDSKTQAQNAINTVSALTPEGFPNNKPILQSARPMIKTSHEDLVAAGKDAKSIIQGLRALGVTTETPTPTP